MEMRPVGRIFSSCVRIGPLVGLGRVHDGDMRSFCARKKVFTASRRKASAQLIV